MKHVYCSGSPYEIGQQHGQAASVQIRGSIEFYEAFFREKTKLDWQQVCATARQFLPFLQTSWPQYVEEMRGIASGADVQFDDIMALNVRTEIAYGMMSDGCTAISWKTDDASLLAQNWDWSYKQTPNILCMRISQPGMPIIHMMTEAGIIGKIGLNSSGVGVTLNAIQAKGVSFEELPTHLALRTVLNSTSRSAAMSTLKSSGGASACHITIADAQTGAVGLECTAEDIVELPMNQRGICTHSNHLIEKHKIQGNTMLEDSPYRLVRINQLSEEVSEPSVQILSEFLKDETNYPAAICRSATEKSTIQTLFSVVMDLTRGFAKVKMGRPTEDGEELELRP